MKKGILAVAMLAMSVAFVSCKTDKKEETTEQAPVEATTEEQTQESKDEHTAEKSLDWAGTYAGTLPCASCPGMDTTIVLNEDGTFARTTVYQEKKDGKVEDKGSFTWDATGSIITLKAGEEATMYKVQEGSLLMLDQEGKEITGEMAKLYVLAKK
ncbi:MAG: copper resistance protein NlpE [Flavobacteriaceae bacterium]|jgi:uncharacterized lipoprotein NlpE involved in copper resistance|nr:copper resistance protein NlpE [Flavobacteriaceae bacterium]